MSKSKVFPEARGSQLARQLELERVLKVKRRSRSRKEKGREMDNVTKLQTKKLSNRCGRAISDSDYETIIDGVERFGRDSLAAILGHFDPTSPKPMGPLYQLLRSPKHRFWSRNRIALTSLACHLREKCQDEFRMPGKAVNPEPAPVLTKSEESKSDIQMFMQQQLEQSRLLVGAVQAMSAAVASLQRPQAKSAPQLPAWGSEDDDAEMGDQEDHSPKSFDEQPTWFKRKVLRDIHSRVGERIKGESGGKALRPHAEAWNRSYEAFHKATGIDVKGRASRLSDKSGHQVRPVEIIDQLNELDRFYGVVKSLWDGWF